jgi:uncharacterized protein (TIRG00374 family)
LGNDFLMEQKKKTGFAYGGLFLAIRLLVVAAGLVWASIWLGQEGRFGKLVAVFKQINPAIFVIALAGYVAGQLVVALRWWILLRTQGIFIPLGAAVRLNFLGMFYNNFMPSSVGGDLVRAWYVTKHTEKRFEAALSVLVDRMVGLLGSTIIAIVFYFLLPSRKDIELSMRSGSFGSSIYQYKTAFIWVALGIGAVVIFLLAIPATRNILRKWWLLGCEQGGRLLRKLVKAGALYCKRPVEVGVVLVLTIALQILSITAYWLVGRQIGVDVSLSYYYVFFTISWSIGMLPVSIGGAVLVEGSLAAMFIKFAFVKAEPALALALCQRIIWMLASLPGGWIHLAGGHLPKDFSIDEGDKTD